MIPRPKVVLPEYRGSGKLAGKVALITGGDSGIGGAVAVLFAKEAADVTISFLNEQRDAEETQELVEAEKRNFFLAKGDIGKEQICQRMVQQTIKRFGRLDIYWLRMRPNSIRRTTSLRLLASNSFAQPSGMPDRSSQSSVRPVTRLRKERRVYCDAPPWKPASVCGERTLALSIPLAL